MSDTPRTDAAYYVVRNSEGADHNMVKADFARELERELTEATRERDRLHKECETALNCSFIDHERADEMAQDKARLDWLEDHAREILFYGDNIVGEPFSLNVAAINVRAAIDAARATP